MEITKVRYRSLQDECCSPHHPLSICSVILDGVMALHSLKVYHGAKGYYVIMPPDLVKGAIPEREKSGMRNKKEKYSDIFHPIDREFYNFFTGTILRGFLGTLEEGQTKFLKWEYLPQSDEIRGFIPRARGKYREDMGAAVGASEPAVPVLV